MSGTHSWVKSVASGLAAAAVLVAAPAWSQGIARNGDKSAPADHAATPAEESEARKALDLALDELRLGRTAAGQRSLESLIARYPDSEAATAARAKIVEIYTAPVRDTPRNSLGVPPPAPAGGTWKVDVRLNPTLGDEFRLKAGDRVFFSTGSAELSGRAREALRQQADWLKRHAALSAVVEGHADEPGSAADLQALAQRRAEAVRQRLVEEGVGVHRLKVVVRGNGDRVALCGDAVCAAQNRRVVTRIEEPPAMPPAGSGEQGSGMRAKPGLPR